MTHAVIVALAALGVVGQAAVAGLGLAALGWAAGVRRPLMWLREASWGYELWLAFLVTALATGGSLFFSEVAHFVPCELCWFQRICMYPLAIATLLMALADDYRPARYLLPLPVVGAGLAVYQLLIENGVVKQTQACLISAPGGCATRWINEFGYMTIPTLALTAFLLVFLLLLAASFDTRDEAVEPVRTQPEAAELAQAVGSEPVEASVRGGVGALRPRGGSEVAAEAVVVLLVLGLVTAAGFVGWVIGHYADGGKTQAATAVVSTPATTTSTTTSPGTVSAAGRAVFTSAGCGSCHTLKAAGSTGSIGPNLDQAKPNLQLVIDRVTNGKGGMPSFGNQLTATQIRDVAAYVAAAARQ